ncbi:hypothetical protein AWC00_26640 [Mycobacterium conspicuum]|nr:hypothetical protein AWC00_26640 [Mycobacterium conspicuum]
MLRLFKYRDEFRVVGETFRVPLPDWLRRVGSPYTADEVRAGDAVALNPGKVIGMDESLPLDIALWPTGVRAEVGCRCKVTTVPIAQLAADVKQTDTTKSTCERIIT